MPSGSPRSFFAELKRRKVYRVSAVYAAVAFVVWQVSEIMVGALGLPEMVMTLIVVGSIVVFPFAVVLAWAYELTPDGVRRTSEVDAANDAASGTSHAGDVEASAASPTPGARRALLLQRVALAATALVVLATGGWWAVGRSTPAEASAMTLAVFPFTVRGNDGLDYLREGLVDLLSRNLSGALELHPLDPSVMLKVTEGSEPGSVLEAGGIARSVGAGQFVTGSVSEVAGRLRIDATLFVLGDSVRALATSSVQGDTTQLFALIDRLTAELLAGRSTGAASERLTRTAALTTSSLPALKAYLEGEQFYRRGEHQDAADAFHRALAEDSAFVLARYRLAVSYHMRLEHDAAAREIARVLADSTRLGTHDRRVAQAFHTYHEGDVETAERQLRAIIGEYPRDLEARVILAELQITYASSRAASLAEAKRLLEEVLEADPQFVCIYCALSGAAEVEGDLDLAERIMHQLEYSNTGDSTKINDGITFYYAAARYDSAAARAAAARLDTIGTAQPWLLGAWYAGGFGLSDVAEHALVKARALGADARALQFYSASAAAGQGHWQRAAAHLDSMVRAATPIDRIARSLLMDFPLEMPVPAIEGLRTQLLAWQDGRLSASQLAEDWPNTLQPASRAYLLGLTESRAGNERAARAWSDSLMLRAGRDTAHAQLIRGLAHTVLADVALRTNQPDAALRELDQVSMTPPPGQLAPWVSAPYYVTRLRAYAHRAAGEHDAALRWLQRGIPSLGLTPAGLYGVHERDLAYTLDALGRTDEARVHYARFIRAWSNADASLQGQVEAARTRLAEIVGES